MVCPTLMLLAEAVVEIDMSVVLVLLVAVRGLRSAVALLLLLYGSSPSADTRTVLHIRLSTLSTSISTVMIP